MDTDTEETTEIVARGDILGQEHYEISQSRLNKAEALVQSLPVKYFSAEIISKAGEIDPNNIEADIKVFDVSIAGGVGTIRE